MDNKYQNQAKLLTRCLSAVSRETCFALKGGTAINFFYSNLPRLSVDIDLTYIDFDERATAFKHIDNSLDSTAANLQKIGIKSRKDGNETKKLICWDQTAIIKIEPNYNIRGYIYKPEEMEVQEKTEREIGYSKVKVLSKAEVYGGKVCAALDRQHPRDLFDMCKFFEQNCFNEQIKNGIMVAFLSSGRNLYELFDSHLQNQEEVYQQEFVGMTDEPFTYAKHIATFEKLKREILAMLSNQDKQFLLNFVRLDADFALSDIPNIDKLPAIRFKIQNLELLRNKDKKKFDEQYDKLIKIFE